MKPAVLALYCVCTCNCFSPSLFSSSALWYVAIYFVVCQNAHCANSWGPSGEFWVLMHSQNYILQRKGNIDIFHSFMLIWFNWDRHVSECENYTSIGQTGGPIRKAMNFIKDEKCKWFQSELKLSTGLGTNCRGLGLKWGFFVLASLLFSSSANGHKYGSTAFQPLATLKKTRVTEAGNDLLFMWIVDGSMCHSGLKTSWLYRPLRLPQS